MNALANSQEEELRKFLGNGYPDGKGPVTFRRYTGQESEEQREEIRQHPPDILLTNYVMLEYILTRPYDGALVRAAQDLSFLVLDELHTYRGRQGSDVALLVRRVRDATNATNLRCVGTSATLAGPGTFAAQRAEVARIATRLFGASVEPANVIGETLRPATAEVDVTDPGFKRGLQRASPPTPRRRASRRQPATRSHSGSSGRSGSPTTTRTTVTCAVSRDRLPVTRAQRPFLPRLPALKLTCAPRSCGRRCWQAARCTTPTASRCSRFGCISSSAAAARSRVSLHSEDERFISTTGQLFVPEHRDQLLMPLVFCRECGQEYMPVRLRENEQGKRVAEPRELNDMTAGDDAIGFFSTPRRTRSPAVTTPRTSTGGSRATGLIRGPARSSPAAGTRFRARSRSPAAGSSRRPVWPAISCRRRSCSA